MLAFALATSLYLAAGCGEEKPAEETSAGDHAYDATVTAPTQTAPAGIVLDPNLQSVTGIPAPEEMKVLINLQKKIPYPVVVPTSLPGGLKLEAELIGSGKAVSDPVAYYSYRYTDPGNPDRFLVFNQTQSNNRELPGYFLYEEEINGINFQVYWHKTFEYLPGDQAVRVGYVGDAETFIIIWKGEYADARGAPQGLYYSITSGTWTNIGWWDIREILRSLKPLGSVGQ